MYKLLGILTFILLNTGTNIYAAKDPVHIRRICNSGNDNTLFWYSSSDTCSAFSKYIIWIRTGTSGPFTRLDSIPTKAIETYTHLGANSGGAKHWYYYIQTIDSCGPSFTVNSDTLDVDNTQNYPSYIDSVSIDILTNQVVIGWHHNEAPDFSLYDPFFQKSVNPSTYDYVVGPQGTRDTFVRDNNSQHNPSLKSLEYDLSTRDSCGNTGVFGENPHKTIFLTQNIDTCKKIIALNWTPYSSIYTDNTGREIQVGWKKVRKYYIFKKINSSQMILIDSVDGTIFSYMDNIMLGQQIQYYIRAIKDTTILITSSSNLCSSITRLRIDPLNTILFNVSVDQNTNNAIYVSIENGLNEEWSSFDIYRSVDSKAIPSKINTIINSSNGNNLITFNDVVDASSSKYFYQIHSINLCGIDVSKTNTSNSILLEATGNNIQNTLSWNKYLYWKSDVEKYNIFRGIILNDGSITYNLIGSVSQNDTNYLDQNISDKIDGQGICYYVQAEQNPGDTHVELSNSNHSCILGDLTVYVPNAFNPFGVNKIFRPEGLFINYNASSIEIFDRWGSKIFDKLDITEGWDGKDSKGQYCMLGVYLYKLKIIGTNGIEKTKTGLVTIID